MKHFALFPTRGRTRLRQTMQPAKPTDVGSKNPNKAALVAGAALFLVLFAIYLTSPIRTSSDSRWSIPTAMSFVRGQWGDLSAYMPPQPGYAPASYSIIQVRERTPTRFIQLVRRYWRFQPLLWPHGGTRRSRPQLRRQCQIDLNRASPLFMVRLLVRSFFWLIFAHFKDLRIAIATTLIFGLGTSMWSTSTRALWQHGPLVFALIGAMLLLLAAQRRAPLAQYVSVPLALSFIIRPTAAIPIAVISAYAHIDLPPRMVRPVRAVGNDHRHPVDNLQRLRLGWGAPPVVI